VLGEKESTTFVVAKVWENAGSSQAEKKGWEKEWGIHEARSALTVKGLLQ